MQTEKKTKHRKGQPAHPGRQFIFSDLANPKIKCLIQALCLGFFYNQDRKRNVFSSVLCHLLSGSYSLAGLPSISIAEAKGIFKVKKVKWHEFSVAEWQTFRSLFPIYYFLQLLKKIVSWICCLPGLFTVSLYCTITLIIEMQCNKSAPGIYKWLLKWLGHISNCWESSSGKIFRNYLILL